MNESMRNHAYTQSEIQEAGGIDFLEDMRNGMYDTICKTCNGKRVVNDKELEKYENDEEYKQEIRREELMLGNYDYL